MNEKERRTSPRIPKMVEIHYSSGSPPISARISDISEKGIFIDTMNPLQVGDTVTFKFSLPEFSEEKPIEGEGLVVWNQETIGMGIEFTKLTDADREALGNFVKNKA